MLERKKILSIILIAIASTIFIAGAYCGVLMLFLYSLRPPGWLVGNTPLIALLVFDAIWLATIKFWPLNIHIKIVSTLLLMAFSAAFVTSYIMAYVLKDFHW
jgi:hypothetical protein